MDEASLSGSFSDLLELVQTHIESAPLVRPNSYNSYMRNNRISSSSSTITSANTSGRSTPFENDHVNNNASNSTKEGRKNHNKSSGNNNININEIQEFDHHCNVTTFKESKKTQENFKVTMRTKNYKKERFKSSETVRNSLISLDSVTKEHISRRGNGIDLDSCKLNEQRRVTRSQNDLLYVGKSTEVPKHFPGPRRWSTLRGIAALGRALSTSSLALKPKRRRPPLSAITVDLGNLDSTHNETKVNSQHSPVPFSKGTLSKKLKMPDVRLRQVYATLRSRRVRSADESLQSHLQSCLHRQHLGYGCRK